MDYWTWYHDHYIRWIPLIAWEEELLRDEHQRQRDKLLSEMSQGLGLTAPTEPEA